MGRQGGQTRPSAAQTQAGDEWSEDKRVSGRDRPTASRLPLRTHERPSGVYGGEGLA